MLKWKKAHKSSYEIERKKKPLLVSIKKPREGDCKPYGGWNNTD